MMNENNPHQCDGVYHISENQIYRCMLPEGHKEDAHMWYITWHEEESGDLMQ
ncbi:MAG: hypothetical protein ACW9W4_06365 [Candidatus Nitrosopumilus sp. bin_7KS]